MRLRRTLRGSGSTLQLSMGGDHIPKQNVAKENINNQEKNEKQDAKCDEKNVVKNERDVEEGGKDNAKSGEREEKNEYKVLLNFS